MANVSLSSGELKKALLFVSVSTVVIGLIVGFLRLAWSGAGEAEEERVVNALVAVVFGLVSGASWAVIFST